MPYPYTYPFYYDSPAVFDIDDTMAEIRYELDDREIYNDIRSEIGILITETIVDADATYSWRGWNRTMRIPPGETWLRMFTATLAEPIAWKLENRGSEDKNGNSYYDYNSWIETTNSSESRAVLSKNTGSKVASISYRISYKFKTSDKITHEEVMPETLTVRKYDATSIRKYGRRVMNLTWAEGTSESDMKSLASHHLSRHKDPVARLIILIKGTTDALRTQIITREISDLITVICTNLGANVDCFINSISIIDEPGEIPQCTWGVEIQRAYELLTLFKLDTSELDGAHVLGS